ncbi:acid phosphatase/Vanadium-dependent haloperoxidase [Meredithblackwellia eburnea MCA 4105]
MFERLLQGPKDRSLQPVDPVRRKRLLLSYLPDWIISILLLGLIAGLTNKAGFKREFSLTDTSIQHTFAVNERVKFWQAIVYAGVIPAVIIIITGTAWRRSLWDVHNGVLGLFLACALATSMTEIIKVAVGRPRPDLIDRCQPPAGAMNAIPYGLANYTICTVDLKGHDIIDGFKSFPSGHSSFSFAGLGFLSFYFAGKMHLFDKNGHAIKAWLCLIPLMGAALIAISRTMDYRHHATDVLVGSLLGLWMAYFTYSLYYPPLNSRKAHLPYSPRIPRDHLSSLNSDTVPLGLNPHHHPLQEEELTVPRPVDDRGSGAVPDARKLDDVEQQV